MNKAYIILFLIIFSYAAVSSEKPDILLEKGKLALTKNDLKVAISYFEQSLKIDSNNYETHYYKGLAHLFDNQFEESVASFTSAILFNEKFPDAYNNRGLAYSYIDQLELAQYDFNKAIELDIRFAEAYVNRGSLNMTFQKFDEAKSDFENAEKINPKNPELYYLKGRLIYFLEDYKSAIEQFSKSINMGLTTAKIYYNRANAYVKNHEYEKAVEDYTKVLEKEVDDPDALNNRAFAYHKMGRDDLAELDQKKATEIREKMFPKLVVNEYKSISDSSNTINLDIPLEWMHWFKESKNRIDILISKDTIDPQNSMLLRGAVGGLFFELYDEMTDYSDEGLLDFWEQSRMAISETVYHYQFKHRKTLRFKGKAAKENLVRIQYSEDHLAFIVYEFAVVNNGKLFFCNFQAPENEFEQYQPVFDKIIQSIEIKF